MISSAFRSESTSLERSTARRSRRFFAQLGTRRWRSETLDGTVDLTDAAWTFRFLFAGEGSLTCSDSADANDDGAVNIADAAPAGYSG